MIQKAEIKLKECVKDSPQSQCSPGLDSWKTSKTSEFLVKCFPQDPKIFIVHAFLVSGDKDIELICFSNNKNINVSILKYLTIHSEKNPLFHKTSS